MSNAALKLSKNEYRIAFCKALGLHSEHSGPRTLMRHCITYHRLVEEASVNCMRPKYDWESLETYDRDRFETQVPYIAARMKKTEELIRMQAERLGLLCSFGSGPQESTVRFMTPKQYATERTKLRARYPEDTWQELDRNVWQKARGADTWNW